MKPTSKSGASGNTCTGQSIPQDRPSFFSDGEAGYRRCRRFFRKAIRHHGRPEVVTIDKSRANTAALAVLNAGKEEDERIKVRQCKYLNNLVEQDHCNIKRRITLMTGFKLFRRAQAILPGIERVHMIRKGQYQHLSGDGLSPAEQFYLMAV